MITRTYRQFASKASGLTPEELKQALNSLGTMPGGRTVRDVDTADIMAEYDIDGNGEIDQEEFRPFVRDLILRGRFEFNSELQQMVAQIARATREDPWAMAMRGDPALGGMIDNLRAAQTAVTNERNNATPRKARRRSLPMRQSVADVNLSERSRRSWESACCCLPMLCCCFPILHPDGRVRSCWNVLMAALIIYCGVAVPLEIAFEPTMRATMGLDGWSAWEAWNLVVDGLFLIDIALSFRSGYIADGVFVKDSTLVCRHYLLGGFLIDLIGAFPLNLILKAVGDTDNESTGRLNRQLRLLRVIKLNRLLRLAKLSKNLKYVELAIKFNPSAMRIVKLLLIMLGFCHWIGCAWWLVAELELPEPTADNPNAIAPPSEWRPSEQLLAAPLSDQFAASFFWGAGMVTAMVPYDIMPTTQVESYFTAVCMFVALILNAFVIGSMASALSTMDSKKAVAAGKLETIGAYLEIHKVSNDLRASILEYYEYVYTSSMSMDDLKLYDELPPSLASRLAISVHRRMLARCAFLAGLSDDVLLVVLSRLKPRIYVPAQFILVEGQPHEAIHFVKKGRVALLVGVGTVHESLVRIVKEFDNFGLSDDAAMDLSQLSEPPYAVESARAETYCDVVSLPCRALREIFNKDKFWDGVATTFRFAQGPADSPTPSLGGSPTSAPSSKKQSPRNGRPQHRGAAPARIMPPRRLSQLPVA